MTENSTNTASTNPVVLAATTAPSEAKRQEVESVIQAWREVREERLEAKRKTDILQTRENLLKEWLVSVFEEQKLEGMLIGGRITGAVSKKVPVVDDREAFIAYIYDNEALDLLQFRLSTTAVKARQENGIEIPGIGEIEVYDLFDRKS